MRSIQNENQTKTYTRNIRRERSTCSKKKTAIIELFDIINNDKPWVLRYQIEYEDEINNYDDNGNGDHNADDDDKNKFRFFVSTKRLLLNASISNKFMLMLLTS